MNLYEYTICAIIILPSAFYLAGKMKNKNAIYKPN